MSQSQVQGGGIEAHLQQGTCKLSSAERVLWVTSSGERARAGSQTGDVGAGIQSGIQLGLGQSCVERLEGPSGALDRIGAWRWRSQDAERGSCKPGATTSLRREFLRGSGNLLVNDLEIASIPNSIDSGKSRNLGKASPQTRARSRQALSDLELGRLRDRVLLHK